MTYSADEARALQRESAALFEKMQDTDRERARARMQTSPDALSEYERRLLGDEYQTYVREQKAAREQADRPRARVLTKDDLPAIAHGIVAAINAALVPLMAQKKALDGLSIPEFVKRALDERYRETDVELKRAQSEVLKLVAAGRTARIATAPGDVTDTRDEQIAALAARVAEVETRPTLKYVGTWTSKMHSPGQFVTHDGSLWHCNKVTYNKPGTSDDFTLAAKRGRDAR